MSGPNLPSNHSFWNNEKVKEDTRTHDWGVLIFIYIDNNNNRDDKYG